MTFFNKKEEVIDLELTPFGEAQMSIGNFKPTYYAFFDDDILYDASGSTGIQEAQNDIETRIQDETVNLRTQYVFSGIEENLRPLISGFRGGEDPLDIPLDNFEGFPAVVDQYYSLIEPIGTMELGSKNAPSWDIKILDGELTGAINYLTSSRRADAEPIIKRIPQLDFDVTCRVLVGNAATTDPAGPIRSRIISRIYEDGTFLYLSKPPPNITLVVDEANTPIDLEYDIEVFMVEGNDSIADSSTLIPMNFMQERPQVVDGILLDQPANTQILAPDNSFVRYFFQVNADTEISSEDICPLLGDLETRGIRLGGIPYDCADVQRIGRWDIYGTNATEEDC